MTLKEIGGIILYLSDDGHVVAVKCGEDYIFKDGVVVSKITDYILTREEKAKLQLNSEGMVKALLPDPLKAEFPHIEEWQFSRNKERIIVQAYVNYPDTTGDEILTKDFQLTFMPDQNTVKSFIYNGKEFMLE